MRAFWKFLFARSWADELVRLRERESLLKPLLRGAEISSYYFDAYVRARERIALLESWLK